MSAPLIALTALAVVAAAPPESADDANRTVVTPSRGGTTSQFDTDRMVHVVGEAELLEAQPLDGPAAVAELPGVFLQRTHRGAGTPFLRGMAGPQNLILVDGVRYNLSTFRTGPNQYAALVDPLALRAVELVMGPGSVLYGSGAMGGTLHYLTADPPREDGPLLRSVLRFASADLGLESSLLAGGRYGAFGGWVGGSVRRHDRLRSGGGDRVPLSGYLQGDWRGKVLVELDDHWQLSGLYLGSRLDDAARVDNLGKGEVRLYDNEDHLTLWRVRRHERRGALRELQLTGAYHRLAERVDRFNCAKSDAGSVVDEAACLTLADEAVQKKRVDQDLTQSIQLQLTADVRLLQDLLRITGGVEAQIDFVQSRREKAAAPEFDFELAERGNFSDSSRYTTADAFLWLEGRPLVFPYIELVLEGGARISHTRASAPDVPDLGNVEYDHTGPAFGAGVRALLFQFANVYVSWAQGFRAPNLQETTVLGDTGTNFEVPNGALGPERSDTVEVGLKVHLPIVRARTSYFHTILSDAIVREDTTWQGASEVDGKQVVHRVNAEEAILDGFEIDVELGPFEGVTLSANLGWLQGDVTHVGGLREPIRREPPLHGRMGIRWDAPPEWAGYWVGAWLDWAAPQERLSSGDRQDLRICQDPSEPGQTLGDACAGSPGWVTVSLGGGIVPVDGLHLGMVVHNLLDADYRPHGSGFDAPGIDVRLTARYDL